VYVCTLQLEVLATCSNLEHLDLPLWTCLTGYMKMWLSAVRHLHVVKHDT